MKAPALIGPHPREIMRRLDEVSRSLADLAAQMRADRAPVPPGAPPAQATHDTTPNPKENAR